jgi:hypothetical protein
MLGPPNRPKGTRPRRRPITVSLEALVPTDHLYRYLEATLGLAFVGERARELYAWRGRRDTGIRRARIPRL